MNSEFPLLSSPVTIGPLELRNRVIMLPHGLAYAKLGEFMPTQRHVDYYAARAHGGVAMICVESAVVSRDGLTTPPLMLVSDPRAVDGFRAIADAVHEGGALIQGQLSHFGNQADIQVTRAPMLGPSSLPDPAVGQQALAMDRAQMDRICDDFVRGARTLRLAGFDSVEIKVGHDGLLRQFLSRLTNDRTDEYGGSIENRLRYPLEVAAAVRDEIGPDMALAVRLTLDERFPGGYDLEEGLDLARALAASGLFTHVTPSVGVWASGDQIVPPMTFHEGYTEEAFTRAANESGMPVVGAGIIRSPAYAERVLAQTGVVAVGMARALITDPEWVNKALRGAASQIRPCTGCNQLCMGNVRQKLPVSCALNPYAGYGEVRVRATSAAERVVIIGGGPAGLEAARAAAEDGCAVVLFEREDRLGGQLRLAASAGRRAQWQVYLSWLERELERLGVDVALGREATVEDVRDAVPGVVVVACGSQPEAASVPGEFTSIDEFLASSPVAGHVAMVQMGSAGLPLWTTALEASFRGADAVTLVTPMPSVAADVEATTWVDLYRDLKRQRLNALTDHVVIEMREGVLRATNLYTDAITEITVDLAVASTPRRGLGSSLAQELGDEAAVVVVGDALLPRDVSAAVREGQDALRQALLAASDGVTAR